MPDEEKQPEMAVCPCCGQPTLKKPIKVDGKIVDDYLACIMTNVPFNHTFNLFDGKLKINVAMADRDEGLKLYRFICMVEPLAPREIKVQDLLGLVKTYGGIKRIDVKGRGNTEKTYFPEKHIAEVCNKLLTDWEYVDLTDAGKKQEFLKAVMTAYEQLSQPDLLSSTPPGVLARVMNDFRAMERIILEAGFDENFWKGIELH